MTSVLGATLAGSSAAVTGTGATITVPAVTAVVCAALPISSGGTSTCTVTLSTAPLSSALTVALSDNSTALSVPASVVVPVGAVSAAFTVTAASITADQSATITASADGTTASAAVTISAPVLPTSLQCAPASIPPGGSATCTVTLSKTAPPGGTMVALSTTISSGMGMPASITVPAGSLSASFSVVAGMLTVGQAGTIAAATGGNSVTTPITLLPPPVALSSLSCSPSSMPPGTTTACTIGLNIPAPAGGYLVTLTSSSTSLSIAPAGLVAAGAASATLMATAGSVTAQQSAVITATAGGSSITAAVTITPPKTGKPPVSFIGNSEPDLVWLNAATRQATVNFYSGQPPTMTGWAWLNSTGAPGWHVVAVADFNGDGVPDLVWENDTTRQVTVNYYGGAGGTNITGWAWLNSAGAPGWHVAAAADFNGDGVPDLVWQNDTTRQVTVNYYGGTGGSNLIGWAWLNTFNNPGWTVAGAVDYNGDGIPDLIWQNDATRQVTLNYYGGTGGSNLIGWAWLNAANNPGWRVVGAADYNGDGVPDLVWQNDANGMVTVNYYSTAGQTFTISGWNWLQPSACPGWTVLVP